MAKDRDINPAQAQRKKEKAAQLKKAKQERDKQRVERLSKLNPERVQRQIEGLEKREREQHGKLLSRDKQLLETLRKDLDDYKKGPAASGPSDSTDSTPHAPDTENRRKRFIRRGNGRGKLSIYWDPILNPFGVPPPGMPDVDRPQVYNNGSESDTDESVKNIPLPTGPIPGHEKPGEKGLPVITAESKTTYSSAPMIRDLVKEAAVLVPSVVQQRRRQQKIESTRGVEEPVPLASVSSRQPVLEEYNGSDEESGLRESDKNSDGYEGNISSAYAPEEEAYMRAHKRKAGDEDSFEI